MRQHLDDPDGPAPQLVRVDRTYELAGPRGQVHLADLFAGLSRLVVYHVVLDPARGEDVRTGLLVLDCLSRLHPPRHTAFAVVVGEPLPRPGPAAWYSCHGDFTTDFHAAAQAGRSAAAVSLFRRGDDGCVYHARARDRPDGDLLHRIAGFGRPA
ncbi:DUF899 family protein [Catellatospora coxensis]|uniref:Uncharacterized protein n=1 Tax=Catellatospora coxensis TaxID=310354 RepID=A0A8J3PAR9_9ACTN|nr:DUF899 family protein [Catellatospora coxensis]GIG10591.1 hypothetical protein Cco03nite_72910 [Catellatospora coxensis]